MKHLRAYIYIIGIEAYYKAPIREYKTFKSQADQTINTEKDNGNI